MQLKILINFWRSLEAAAADNNDGNSNSVIFTIKDTKLYVLVVNLSEKDNQKI